jgi:hypothetical protein
MFGNIGGLISTWSFLPTDAPNVSNIPFEMDVKYILTSYANVQYPIGNGLNLATSSTILISSILLLLWMNRSNKQRKGSNVDQELAGMSAGQIEDLDWRHPSFRWRP